MKYQDELESGKRSRKGSMKFSEQVEYYRQKLLKKVTIYLYNYVSYLNS